MEEALAAKTARVLQLEAALAAKTARVLHLEAVLAEKAHGGDSDASSQEEESDSDSGSASGGGQRHSSSSSSSSSSSAGGGGSGGGGGGPAATAGRPAIHEGQVPIESDTEMRPPKRLRTDATPLGASTDGSVQTEPRRKELPVSVDAALAVVVQMRAARMVGTEGRSDVPQDVIQAIRISKRTMSAALSRLSSDLYTNKSRWLLELLQNADDNEYHVPVTAAGTVAPANTLPRVDITVTDGQFELRNNERGFTTADVEALCDVGATTKTAVNERAGRRCIGEKGIGFKSVFAVSDTPFVRSNFFSFMFDKQAVEGVGCLVPHWVASQDFPPCSFSEPNASATGYTAGTQIVLPYRKYCPTDDGNTGVGVWQTVEALDPLVLLFLRQLRALTLTRQRSGTTALATTCTALPPAATGAPNASVQYRRTIQMDDSREGTATGGLVLIEEHTCCQCPLVADVRTSYRFQLFRHRVSCPSDVLASSTAEETGAAATAGQKSISRKTEVTCAFPTHAEDGSADAGRLHDLFVFLPTRPYGLRFPLHAEFVLPSSREEVRRDSIWNRWLAVQVGASFVAAVKQLFLQAVTTTATVVAATTPPLSALQRTWYRYIPRRADLAAAGDFFLPAHKQVISQLSKIKCIVTQETGWQRPSRVVIVLSPQSEGRLRRLRNFVTDAVLRAALNMEFAADGVDDGCGGETLVEMGCRRLSCRMLQKCMQHRSFVADMRSRDDDWLHALYGLLEQELASYPKWIDNLRQIPLIRLADGTHCCALPDQAVDSNWAVARTYDTRLIFFPSRSLDKWMLAPYLNIVKPELLLPASSCELSVNSPPTAAGAGRCQSEADALADELGLCMLGDGGKSASARLLVALGVSCAKPHAIIGRYIIPYHQQQCGITSGGQRKFSEEERLLLCIQLAYVKEHVDEYLALGCLKQHDGATPQPPSAQLGASLLISQRNCVADSAAVFGFAGAGRLYLPSCYIAASEPGVEQLFAGDASVLLVDSCYLSIERPKSQHYLRNSSMSTSGIVIANPGATESAAPSAAAEAQRREGWLAFFVRLGCLTVPGLSRKEHTLSPSQALTQLNIRVGGGRATGVHVTDHVLSHEFRRSMITAQCSHEASCALLRLIDRYWDENYSDHTTCAISTVHQGHLTTQPNMSAMSPVASFVQEIRGTMLVPTTLGDRRPIGDVFYLSNEITRMFGEEVMSMLPFLALELSSSRMKCALGMTTAEQPLSVELAMSVLRAEQARCCCRAAGSWSTDEVLALKRRVTAAYEVLRLRLNDERGACSDIAAVFCSEPLICVPDNPPRFLVTTQVCWTGTEVNFGTQHGFLETHFGERGLLQFFCGELRVARYLHMRDIADRLVEVSQNSVIVSAGKLTPGEQQLVGQIYARLELWLRFSAGEISHSIAGNGHGATAAAGAEGGLQSGPASSWPAVVDMDWQCLDTLKAQPVFLSLDGYLVFWNGALVADEQQLEDSFPSAKLRLFNLAGDSHSECGKFQCLIRHFGLPRLSACVTASPLHPTDEQPAKPQPSTLLRGWTLRCRACLEPIARYLWHRVTPAGMPRQQQIDSRQPWQAAISRLAARLSCHGATPLRVRYTVAGNAPYQAQPQPSCVASRPAIALPLQGVIMLDRESAHENLDAVAAELVRLVTTPFTPPGVVVSTRSSEQASPLDVDLVNFVELLLAKRSSGAIERMLVQRLRIPTLGADISRSLGLLPCSRVNFSEYDHDENIHHAQAGHNAGDLGPCLDASASAAAAEMVVDTLQTKTPRFPVVPQGESLRATAAVPSTPADQDLAHGGAVRQVSAAHRENSVRRQQLQGLAAELRFAQEEAHRIWPALSQGQSDSWGALCLEFRRINQLGARGGTSDLIDVSRPGSVEALASRLHVAKVVEGVGYDVLTLSETGQLHRVEIKCCAGRRRRPGNHAAGVGPTAAAGLRFYMSEAERRMAALYLQASVFAADAWRLVVYAPALNTQAPGGGGGDDSTAELVDVAAMARVEVTQAVKPSIISAAEPPDDDATRGMLRPTSWAFSL